MFEIDKNGKIILRAYSTPVYLSIVVFREKPNRGFIYFEMNHFFENGSNTLELELPNEEGTYNVAIYQHNNKLTAQELTTLRNNIFQYNDYYSPYQIDIPIVLNHYPKLRNRILEKLERYCSFCNDNSVENCIECNKKDRVSLEEELQSLMLLYFLFVEHRGCMRDCRIIDALNVCNSTYEFYQDVNTYYSSLLAGEGYDRNSFIKQYFSKKSIMFYYFMMFYVDSLNYSLKYAIKLYEPDKFRECFKEYKCDWDCIRDQVNLINHTPPVLPKICIPVEFIVNVMPYHTSIYLYIEITNYVTDDDCDYNVMIRKPNNDVFLGFKSFSELYGFIEIELEADDIEAGINYDISVYKKCDGCDTEIEIKSILIKEEVQVCEKPVFGISNIGYNSAGIQIYDCDDINNVYEIEFGSESDSRAGEVIEFTGCVYMLSGLKSDGQYDIYLRKKCDNGLVSESAFGGFTTLDDTPPPLCDEPEFTYEIIKENIKYSIKVNIPHDINDGCVYKLYYNVIEGPNKGTNGSVAGGDMENTYLEGLFNEDDKIELKVTKECPYCQISSTTKTIIIAPPIDGEIKCEDFDVLVELNTIEKELHNLIISIVDNQKGCDYVINALNTKTWMHYSITLVFPNKNFTIENVKNNDIFSIEVTKICDGCEKNHSTITYEVIIDDDDDDDLLPITENCNISITKTNENHSYFTIYIHNYKAGCKYNLYGILDNGSFALLAQINSATTTFNKNTFVVNGVTSFYVGYKSKCGDCEKEISNTITITL